MRALLFHPGSLGDTVVSLPVIMRIRQELGTSCELWLLHEDRPSAVAPEEVLRHTGLIDRYLTYSGSPPALKTLSAAIRLWYRLRHLRFSKVFYMLGSKRPGIRVYRDEVFFRLCGIPERLGFHALNPERRAPRDPDGFPATVMHEATARAERLMADGLGDCPAQQQQPRPHLFGSAERESVDRLFSSMRKHPQRPLIAICPGTNMPSKAWPSANFSEIGRRLLAVNQFEIVLVGGKGDRAIAAELIHQWNSGINTCGNLSVSASASLLSLCRLCLCLDSGPMHLSAAVGTPCVALFSGRDYPGRWDPPGEANRVLRHPVKCGGCMAEVCPLPAHPCMSNLTVARVWDAISAALKNT